MTIRLLCLAASAAFFFSGPGIESVDAGYRQYYSRWNYHPTHRYYYTRYYYKPTVSYPTYSYHYCVRPAVTSRYVYYYNPHSRRYWGRFDTQGKPGEQYSMLKPEDRKEKLEDIPEKAFPKPGKMPLIPAATDDSGTKPDDDVRIKPVPELPEEDPADAPLGGEIK